MRDYTLGRVRPGFHVLTVATGLLAALSAAAACKDSNKSPSDPRAAQVEDARSAVIAAGDAAPAPPDRVEILLDDVRVTTIAASDLKERRPIDEVVAAAAGAYETWLMVEASGPASRYTSLYKPQSKHPGSRIYVYADAKGVPVFGLFLADAESPKILQRGIDRVNVVTKAPQREPPAPAGELTVSAVGKPPRAVDDKSLEALPEASQPGGEGSGRGWYLRDVIGLVDAAGATSVRLTPSEGDHADITMAEVHDANLVAFMRRNRRGQWRFKMWSVLPDGNHKLIHSLHDVVSIELR